MSSHTKFDLYLACVAETFIKLADEMKKTDDITTIINILAEDNEYISANHRKFLEAVDVHNKTDDQHYMVKLVNTFPHYTEWDWENILLNYEKVGKHVIRALEKQFNISPLEYDESELLEKNKDGYFRKNIIYTGDYNLWCLLILKVRRQLQQKKIKKIQVNDKELSSKGDEKSFVKAIVDYNLNRISSSASGPHILYMNVEKDILKITIEWEKQFRDVKWECYDYTPRKIVDEFTKKFRSNLKNIDDPLRAAREIFKISYLPKFAVYGFSDSEVLEQIVEEINNYYVSDIDKSDVEEEDEEEVYEPNVNWYCSPNTPDELIKAFDKEFKEIVEGVEDPDEALQIIFQIAESKKFSKYFNHPDTLHQIVDEINHIFQSDISGYDFIDDGSDDK